MARIKRPPNKTVDKTGQWINNSITDWDNKTVDVGRVSVFFIVFGLVSIVIFAMLLFTGWDVIVNKQSFNPQNLGMGVGGLLGGISTVLIGLGVYLFGDSRSREALETLTPLTNLQGNQNGATKEGQGDANTKVTTIKQAKTSTNITVTEETDLSEGIPPTEIGNDGGGRGDQGAGEGGGRNGSF